ncbi:hypothetical protein MHU86_17156 [Fragilaria crotonensis]|nr:hypothetical protein MHU86_20220 [Fragilaria crotonensis]KAI2497336.1 hypothetical protein MHU86_17156 [Fragilaria crotonensis]
MRIASIVVAALCATSQAFSPSPLSKQGIVLAAKGPTDVAAEDDHGGFGRRIRRTGKTWKRHVAAVALASVAFRLPRPSEASVAASVPPMAFQSEIPDETVGTQDIKAATAVVAAGGAGAVVAKYILKRGEKVDPKESDESSSIETQESPPVVDDVSGDAVMKQKKLIANLLEKVKDAEEKVLVRSVKKENPVQKASQFRTALSPKSGEIPVEPGYSKEDKMKIVNNVFDCHGFFPDLRGEDELPLDVRLMRQQPKSKSALLSIKSKYEAIPDESERVYTMLVDLGMMESYDHLDAYSDDFDDEDVE